jgi:hypothetical protein
MSKQIAPTTRKRRGFDLKDMPYYAAVFQSLQFAHAGSVYFGLFGWLIGGVGGAITNIAIAAASSRIGEISDKRKPLARVLIVLLYFISPMAIAPAAYIVAGSVAVPWIRIMVSIVWAALPDLSIGLMGAITGKGFLFSSGDGTKRTTTTTKPKKKPKQVAKQPISDQAIIDYFLQNQGATPADAARFFKVSGTAIRKRLKNLTLPPGVSVGHKAAKGQPQQP